MGNVGFATLSEGKFGNAGSVGNVAAPPFRVACWFVFKPLMLRFLKLVIMN